MINFGFTIIVLGLVFVIRTLYLYAKSFRDKFSLVESIYTLIGIAFGIFVGVTLMSDGIEHTQQEFEANVREAIDVHPDDDIVLRKADHNDNNIFSVITDDSEFLIESDNTRLYGLPIIIGPNVLSVSEVGTDEPH